MRLVERYIFGRTLSLSMLALFSTTVMVLVTQVLIYVNVLTASGQAIGTFFALAATLIPAMVNIVMPFALHIGASQTLNTMNSDSELAVIESAGGSPVLTARPIFVLALIFSIVSVLLSLFIEPWSDRNKRDIVTRASADLISVAVQSGSFQKIQDGLYLQVAEQLPSGEFAGIFISDSRDPVTELIYYAKHGVMRELGGANILALADGEIHRRAVATGDLSVIRFASYFVDLNQFTAAVSGGYYKPGEQSTAYLLYGNPGDDYFKQRKPGEVRAELNRRFSSWLYPLCFAAIAVFFGGRASSNREERIWNVTLGAAIAVAIRGAGFYFTNESGQSDLYAVLTFAVPAAAIAFFAVLIVSKKSLPIPRSVTDRTALLVDRAVQLWNRYNRPGTPDAPGTGGRA